MIKALVLALLLAAPAVAQQRQWTVETLPPPAPVTAASNSAPNPYRSEAGFLKLPPGRTMGSTSGVAVDSKGHIWVADRCGANSCLDSPLDPIMEFDAKGNFIQAFGRGLLVFPHGFSIDAQDNIWITDPRVGKDKAGTAKGAQVLKFSRAGKLLLALGKPGITGPGPDEFTEPSSVLVTSNGTIFVGDGHEAGLGNSRIMKFDARGKLLKAWGEHGFAPGQFDALHGLAMDSKGRLFVADRWNNRVQIYTQDGKLLDSWQQFGRPSGVYIDKQDTLYVADSESRRPVGYGYNPGWQRGIRIGSARTGKVTAFIPDPEPKPDAGATSGAEGIWVDSAGVIYGGQVKERAVMRYLPN
ncbi:MAG: peptidyl-alpha-hydroxyglycine alpha-amidating lyase family protein [Polymorphobacter sp.]